MDLKRSLTNFFMLLIGFLFSVGCGFDIVVEEKRESSKKSQTERTSATRISESQKFPTRTQRSKVREYKRAKRAPIGACDRAAGIWDFRPNWDENDKYWVCDDGYFIAYIRCSGSFSNSCYMIR